MLCSLYLGFIDSHYQFKVWPGRDGHWKYTRHRDPFLIAPENADGIKEMGSIIGHIKASIYSHRSYNAKFANVSVIDWLFCTIIKWVASTLMVDCHF
ncbi:MAG: hypothetical protein VCF25_32380 [Candidatus Poribacteria bacterium]